MRYDYGIAIVPTEHQRLNVNNINTIGQTYRSAIVLFLTCSSLLPRYENPPRSVSLHRSTRIRCRQHIFGCLPRDLEATPIISTIYNTRRWLISFSNMMGVIYNELLNIRNRNYYICILFDQTMRRQSTRRPRPLSACKST